jgi:hypothetical protein
VGGLEALLEPARDAGVEVEAAQEVVAAGAGDLQVVAGRLQHRGVERAAAQVVYQQALAG